MQFEDAVAGVADSTKQVALTKLQMAILCMRAFDEERKLTPENRRTTRLPHASRLAICEAFIVEIGEPHYT